MKILNIVSYDLERPNGIKTVLNELTLEQKKMGIISNIYNVRSQKNIVNYKEYDLIIFHGIYFYNYLKIYREINLESIPYIIVPHCSFTKESFKRGRIKKIIFNFFARKYYKRARAIGFLNEEESQNSVHYNEKNIILPNGINLPLKREINIKNEKINLIYLSRIDIHHKGLDLLLKALFLIKNELEKKQVIVNIYGNAFYKKDLKYLEKTIKKYSLEKILKYHGEVKGEKKEMVLSNSDIFILTSRFEGFPMSVLEALSYGLPCILTEGTNMKSMIEEYNSGWICKTEVEDISNTILRTLDEYLNDSEKYSRNAFCNSRDYSWNEILIKHITEYKKILEKSDCEEKC